MSWSNPQKRIPNPTKLWLEWNGKGETFRTYDKETKQKKDVIVKRILVIKQMACITGFDAITKKGYYSNEVSNAQEEFLYLKEGDKLIMKSKWSDEMKSALPKGAHYTASIYASVDGVLTNIKLKSSQLNVWIEINKTAKKMGILDNFAVAFTGCENRKNGVTDYTVPSFSLVEPTKEEIEKAAELEKEFTAFLDSKRKSKESIESEADTEDEDEYEDSGNENNNQQPQIIEDYDNNGSEDDLPF